MEIPYGYCHCGCGEKTPLAPKTLPKHGVVKGAHLRYILGHNGKARKIPLAEKLWARVDRKGPDDCWEWRGPTVGQACHPGKNHGTIATHKVNGTARRVLTHRLAYELTYGPIPAGMCVLHMCDNPPCCNPSHLRLGTIQDNNRDMYDKGRGRPGPERKISPAQAVEIRERQRTEQLSQAALAAAYGVTQSLIHSVIHRKGRFAED